MDIRKIYTGSKFYRYIDGKDKPEIIRIRNVDYDKEIVKYFDPAGEKKKVKFSSLLKDYKMLSPDGLISFSIVDINQNPDVIIALKKFPKTEEELDKMDNLPYAVCRQMAADVFSMYTNTEDATILGVSISKDTCPPNVDFNLMLACTGLKYSRMVAVYLDDTLDSILSCFDNQEFDKTLTEIWDKFKDTSFTGFSKTLRDLMGANNFMYDFRKCFKIVEVPFHINEDDEALSEDNIAYLQKEMNISIMETYVTEFTKEIDLRSIKRDYIFVSSAEDCFSKIYIVGIDKVR